MMEKYTQTINFNCWIKITKIILAMSKPRFFWDRNPSTLPSFQKKTNLCLFPNFLSLSHYRIGSFSFDPTFFGTNPFVSFRSWKALEFFCSFLFDLKFLGTNPFVYLLSWKALEYLCSFPFDPKILETNPFVSFRLWKALDRLSLSLFALKNCCSFFSSILKFLELNGSFCFALQKCKAKLVYSA